MMRNKLLTAALLLLCFVSAQAQSSLKDQIKTFNNKGRFAASYDRFKNITHVTVGPFFMQGMSLQMTAAFSFDGEVQHGLAKGVWLLFDSSSSDWQFLNGRELFAIVDQERVALGEGIRTSTVASRPTYGRYVRPSVTVRERLAFAVPFDTFEKISKGKIVDMRVGQIELTLKDEHLLAFRDLLSLRSN